MQEARYRLVFNGQIDLDLDADEVRKNVLALLKIDQADQDKLFSGRKIVLKDGLTLEEVLGYQSAFERTGAISLVEKVEDAAEASGAVEAICCPKCGLQQEKSAACTQCGVVFEKYSEYLARQEEKATAEAMAADLRLQKERERYERSIGVEMWAPALFRSVVYLLPILVLVYLFNLKYGGPYSAPDRSFSVSFPGYPHSETSVGKEEVFSQYVYEADKCEYYVSCWEFKELEVSSEEGLEMVRESIANKSKVLKEEKSAIDGHTARIFDIEVSGGKTERLEACMEGKKLYIVGLIAPKDRFPSSAADEFIRSFHLQAGKS